MESVAVLKDGQTHSIELLLVPKGLSTCTYYCHSEVYSSLSLWLRNSFNSWLACCSSPEMAFSFLAFLFPTAYFS